jgi:predicted phage terminase large subunit-like protein
VIRDDVDAKQKFANNVGGVRTSRGLTSKIIGNRADCILIDDPNDAYEVFSEASRREVKGKWDSAIYNRVNDPRVSCRIGVQQIVHDDDWSHHWLHKAKKATGLERVVHVSLPMEFDPERAIRKTVLGPVDWRTRAGEILDPVRFTPELLASERERLGQFSYESQYNQNARPLGGGMFERRMWRFFRMPGQLTSGRAPGCEMRTPAIELETRRDGKLMLDFLHMTVDASFGSTNDSASQVGLLLVGGREANRFVFDDRTKRMSFNDTCSSIDRMLRDYAADERFPPITKILVEKKANGAAIIESLGARFPGFIAIEPEGGKIARAHAMEPSVAAGNVYLLESADWMRDFVDELALFPNGRFDDRVDAMSQLMIYNAVNLSMVNRWAAMSR